MNSTEIEKSVRAIVDNFDRSEFIYDLLMAYGISKTSITRLKKGDFNLSKTKGEILYKKKVLFKEVESEHLLTTIDAITKSEDELKHNPRFVIVTDFETILAKDIRTGLTLDTPLLEIHKRYDFFLPWAGQEKYHAKNENDADRNASYKMAKLYDILVQENPNIYLDGGHNLNIFLSRLLFCFFADDTLIFPTEGMFSEALSQHTKESGVDINIFLDRLFKVLNTKDNSDEPDYLKAFPYVNGGLFNDNIISPKFNKEARRILQDCGSLRWNEINPDIFGSMIQAVVNPKYRSGLGMHYTSVPNIMKVIEPLFLDQLKEDFEKGKGSPTKLRKLIFRLSKIKIFDPACGSGNFLIIAYKELRRLEIEMLQHLYDIEKQISIVFTEIKLSQFYGIELDDFAHEMAILSLWLAEHQMNKEFIEALHDYGRAKPILPLKEAGHITHGNAARISWETVCPKEIEAETYILGNPPYLGYSRQDKSQKADMEVVFGNSKDFKKSDYIACWFLKGAEYIKGEKLTKLAFVSTNSVCQGIQVNMTWQIIKRNKVQVNFAHTSFKWENNAKHNAGVFVVIIGLVSSDLSIEKTIYHNSLKLSVSNISPYLTNTNNTIVLNRLTTLSNLPNMVSGLKAGDGGYLILDESEKIELLTNYPESERLVKKYIGANEFMNGINRFCLWVDDQDKELAYSIPPLRVRFEACKQLRLSSKKAATIRKASTPHQFDETNYLNSECIFIPQTGSERREYLPIGFLDAGYVISNGARVVYGSNPWLFGLLCSKMHVTWVKAVAGRLKMDMQYSNTLCYNTFPFPNLSEKQKEQINLHVFEVLDERAKFSEKTMAQLYDPTKMPRRLKEAHYQLDLAVERCYRLKPFENDIERIEYLFKTYEDMSTLDTLFQKEKQIKKAN